MTETLATAREPLAAWFREHARALPWRRRRDAYAVWVSEVMLQQTRADTVAPYFEHWLRRFPDVRALADADEESVLRAWEGLGYYRRARNLHRAARHVMADGGALPRDEAGWRALPGVGPYTAAAISVLAGGEATVAIDANVRRVGARLLALHEPSERELKTRLAALLDPHRPAEGAEALIELGALVCTPRQPACHACPLRAHCRARALGAVAEYPRAKRRRTPPRRHRYARVHRCHGSLWLVRRREAGMLGGLWGFPQQDEAPAGRALSPLQHAYTHLRLELTPVLVEATPEDEDGRWFDAAALRRAPLSGIDRRLIAHLGDADDARDGLLSSEP